ncbi:MAG: hypothetical protein ACFFAO_13530 [Candidatus Hermodarchaeota archaeon]
MLNITKKETIEKLNFCIFFISNQLPNKPKLIEAILHAKNLNKPLVIFTKKGTINQVLGIIKGANIKAKYVIDKKEDLLKIRKKLKKKLKNLK